MERNVQKSGLVNLAAALFVFLAAFAVAAYANSLAGQAASVFLGLGVLVAFASWFQGRLEENERLEKLEMDELARAKGDSALFAAKASEVFPARRAREQFEKFFVPGFAVLLLALEAGAAWLLWRWTGKTLTGVSPDRAMTSLALFAIYALLLFLFGRFSVTIARLENLRLLRPSASFILAGGYACFATAVALAGVKTQFPRADFFIARGFCVLLALMSVELLVSLLLEIYRPRVKGRVSRPLYDSRFVGLLAQPESLFTTAAQALDYQFGFKVSETWFFQLLRRNLPILLIAQLAALLLSTCIVFVDAGEQAVLEHFGRPVATLNPGAHFKLPWPVDSIARFRTDQIQSLAVGYEPSTNAVQVILWTVAHNETNFLVGSRAPATLPSEESGPAGSSFKATSVAFINVSIPVQFRITDVRDWAYNTSDAKGLLEDLATHEVVRYLAGADMIDLLTHLRSQAAQELQQRIQAAADAHHLGVEIIFVGLQDIHPPQNVAADFENVVAASETRQADILQAQANAIRTNLFAGARAFTVTNVADAAREKMELSAFADAALFTNQIPAFAASPLYYEQRAYYQAFAESTANARKYILFVTNTYNVFTLDLEDKIGANFLNQVSGSVQSGSNE